MSIAHLLDHTARIWRRVETRSPYGGMVPSYVEIEGQESLDCASDGKEAVQSLVGPGVAPSGDRWLYFDVGPEFPDRGLVELRTGPTSPAWLEIESADPFRGNHVEVRVSEFNGTPPEVGS